MTSMGDVVHALPAITEALSMLPNITFDWVVEEGFSEIPCWHLGVSRVIPIALRRWRKNPIKAFYSGECKIFFRSLRAQKYDVVIDAQGLLKSAVISYIARGKRYGLNRKSAKEGLASWFYHVSQEVSWNLHAIERIRQLFGLSLQYSVPATRGKYNLNKQLFLIQKFTKVPYVVFVHGASRTNKLWVEEYWCQLAEKVISLGMQVFFPWGGDLERQRADRLVININHRSKSSNQGKAIVLEKSTLTQIAQLFVGAKAVVSIDTGLSHIAAALDIPLVSMYSVTNPESVGAYGTNVVNLTPSQLLKSEKIMSVVTTQQVWESLHPLLTGPKS